MGQKKLLHMGMQPVVSRTKRHFQALDAWGMSSLFLYDIVFRDAYWSLCKLPTISFSEFMTNVGRMVTGVVLFLIDRGKIQKIQKYVFPCDVLLLC